MPPKPPQDPPQRPPYIRTRNFTLCTSNSVQNSKAPSGGGGSLRSRGGGAFCCFSGVSTSGPPSAPPSPFSPFSVLQSGQRMGSGLESGTAPDPQPPTHSPNGAVRPPSPPRLTRPFRSRPPPPPPSAVPPPPPSHLPAGGKWGRGVSEQPSPPKRTPMETAAPPIPGFRPLPPPPYRAPKIPPHKRSLQNPPPPLPHTDPPNPPGPIACPRPPLTPIFLRRMGVPSGVGGSAPGGSPMSPRPPGASGGAMR